MFFRLLIKSLARRRSRKLLAVVAVWIGITLVVGLLALSLDVGDKINRESRSFGANIKLTPAGAALPVRVGGHELAAAVQPAYLDEADLAKLKTIFWKNNILGVVPRLWVKQNDVTILGIPFDAPTKTMYAHWKISGAWPATHFECLVGADFAREKQLTTGSAIFQSLEISGIVTTGGAEDNAVIFPLAEVQQFPGLQGKISEADISALTTPENKLAEKFHLDPKLLTSAESERFYCTPFPTSVASNIQATIPNSVARVVRRVSESQGAVFTRIQGLITLLGLLGVVACSLSVMGVLTSAVLERRTEVALLQAIGARGNDVLRLFLAEAGLLGLAGGMLASGTGLLLGRWLISSVFGSTAEIHFALLLAAPLFGLFTALMASAIPIWQTLRQKTAQVLHGN